MSRKGWRNTLSRLFTTKTDIPLRVSGTPGDTMETRNIVYCSGSDEWKARTAREAAGRSPDPQPTDLVIDCVMAPAAAGSPSPPPPSQPVHRLRDLSLQLSGEDKAGSGIAIHARTTGSNSPQLQARMAQNAALGSPTYDNAPVLRSVPSQNAAETSPICDNSPVTQKPARKKSNKKERSSKKNVAMSTKATQSSVNGE